jgi:hypothetical protein
MTEVVPFPGAMPAPEVHTELDPNKVHAEAFRDLEGEVCDLERAGAIARDLIAECAAREDSFRKLELAQFAVWQVAKLAEEFKQDYYKRWHGEKRRDQ